jgi:hypothetical protein
VTDEKSATLSTVTAEQAMNSVLAAEREAAQAIADCEAEARNLLQAARKRSNHIADRSDERITLMQMRCAKSIAQTLQQLAREQKTQGERSAEALDDAGIRRCMEAIAETLTTGTVSDAGNGDAGK